ncbi:MAG: hypothetical protein ACR2P2_06605 [Nakamurella sp.]
MRTFRSTGRFRWSTLLTIALAISGGAQILGQAGTADAATSCNGGFDTPHFDGFYNGPPS